MLQPNNIKSLTLYHFRACPYCAVTHRAIQHLGIEVQLKDIQKTPKFRNELINGGGKAQVPCLLIESKVGRNQWLYESSEIIQYLNEYQKSKEHLVAL